MYISNKDGYHIFKLNIAIARAYISKFLTTKMRNSSNIEFMWVKL